MLTRMTMIYIPCKSSSKSDVKSCMSSSRNRLDEIVLADSDLSSEKF